MVGHLAPELPDFGHLNAPGALDGDGLEIFGAEQRADAAPAHLPVGLGTDAGKGDPVLAGRPDGQALHAVAHFLLQGLFGFKDALAPQEIRILEGDASSSILSQTGLSAFPLMTMPS